MAKQPITLEVTPKELATLLTPRIQELAVPSSRADWNSWIAAAWAICEPGIRAGYYGTILRLDQGRPSLGYDAQRGAFILREPQTWNIW